MTVFYIDPVGGNDANDGTTFANRWKTLTNGASAARIAPGDEIRLIESPPPNSIGNVQWTDNSDVLTPAVPKNKLIDDFSVAWTAAPNVTATAGTTASALKAGPAYLNLAPASGFTTGKMAYKTLGATLDLSAFQQLSMHLGWSSTSRDIELKLCSDTLGDVPVATFSLAATFFNAGQIRIVVFDNGAPLPSNINSIAFYAPTDPGTSVLRCCNLVACKAPGPDEITHASLIGKNTLAEPEWYNINEITDTDLYLGASLSQFKLQDPARPYRGTTELTDTYILNPIPGWLNTDRTIQDSGTTDAPIKLTGGWNRTDMSTQSGESWLTGYNNYGSIVNAVNTRLYWDFENIGLANYQIGLGELNHGWRVNLLGLIGCDTAFSSDSPPSQPCQASVNIGQIWGTNSGIFSLIYTVFEFTCNRIHGDTDTSAASSGVLNNPKPDVIGEMPLWRIGKIDNNASYGVEVGYSSLRLHGCIFENNQLGDIKANGLDARKWIQLDSCELNSSIPIVTSAAEGFMVKETNIGGNYRLHKSTFNGGVWYTTETSPHTPGGVNWVLEVTSASYYAAFPCIVDLCKIAVKANKLVTVKCWARRDNTGLEAGLLLDYPGPGLTKTMVPITVGAGVWEELTLTFTPTAAGVIPINVFGYGGTTYKAEFADMTITQED